jgi:UDPglucose 6-dehydrogenase
MVQSEQRRIMGLERITVFGLGRVGLIMAVCLAKRGYEVLGFDVDSNLVERLQDGETPFYEPNLSEYLAAALQKNRFTATTDPSINSRSDLAYISVGTPSLADGTIDLSYVEEAAKTIGRTLRDSRQHQLVVVKSTVTPGTARNLIKPAVERESKRSAGTDFAVCSNPEFLREGNAIHDTEFPDRIVIGSDDPAAIEKLENIYRQFHGAQFPPIIRTTFENAELTKYTNNAFLATKVSFINCIAGIAERIPHADIKAVAEGIGLDERIGSKFLNAGLGWGGSCFPKDLSALVSLSKKIGYDAELIAATVSTNRKQPRKAVELAKKALGSLAEKQIAVLGLSFKPETDDMRDAVSIPIINGLLTEGARVTVWDPEAMVEARRIFGDRIRYATGALECLEQADCCILATEWAQFKKLRPKTFLEEMRHPVVIDGRRLYDPSEFKNAGIGFHAIGLGPA